MLCILYIGTVPTLCILNVGTVPPWCVLYVGTVPTLCIWNVGTVLTLCIWNVGTVPTLCSFRSFFWSVRDPYYRWQAGSTLPCSKIDIVNTAEYLDHHQSNLNPKKKKKVRDPHFRWQAGSSLPCHSFHRMWVSGASITTLNHKKGH